MEAIKSLSEQVLGIPWFDKVSDSVWDNWPGPESPEVARIGDRTQELIDALENLGVEAEPHISNAARALMETLSSVRKFNTEADLYDPEYFASWIGLWLLVTRAKFIHEGLDFPGWAEELLNVYKNGLWPWGLDDKNLPLCE